MHREGNGNLQQRREICCISSFNPRRISQRSSIRVLSLYTRSSDVEGGKGGSEPVRKARAREWEAGRAVGTSHSQARGYSEPRQNCPWHTRESGCRERGVEIYSCSECALVCVCVRERECVCVCACMLRSSLLLTLFQRVTVAPRKESERLNSGICFPLHVSRRKS